MSKTPGFCFIPIALVRCHESLVNFPELRFVMERHGLDDLSQVPAAVAQWKMLVDMLHVEEVIEQRLPSSLKLGAALAAVITVLDDHHFRMLAAALVSIVEIQSVKIERDRHFAK